MLSDMWGLTPKSEDEKVTCPVCAGCGKDLSSLDYKCFECNGTGKITKERKEWLKGIGY